MFKLKINQNTLFTGIIFLVVAILFITNYTPNTYLSGWDSLQTELHPTLAIKRAFFSVWQEYQSLGLVAGMAHAADLVRAIFIWIISFFLPQTITRYFFHMLMLLIGGLSTFKLLKLTGFTKEKNIFALLGALFYILNFGTTQIFFLPFESFSVFYAFLPLLLWIFLEILTLNSVTKRGWIKFVIINLLATPFAVSQQLFVVYILILLLISLSLLVSLKRLFPVKKVIMAFVILFFINSFWILPQAYFLLSASSVVSQSKQNQLITQDVFYNNLNKGNINDFLRMEGFFSEQLDPSRQPLFLNWQQYRKNPIINTLVYLFAFIPFLGLFSKRKYRLSFILLYLFTAITLLSNTAVFQTLNDFIRSNNFINQVFRSPFTKFIIPYALLESYFFASGLVLVFERITKDNQSNLRYMYALTTGIFLFIYAFPAFKGSFISPQMRVKIPQEYFVMFDYFKYIDPDKRIALLPDYTFWGWFNHNWGYNGSGFLWYGIEQPVISRNFDMWSFKSESYFWEIKNAIETEDVNQFENVLEKYNVDFLIFDHSLLPVSINIRAIQYDRIESLLKESKRITVEKQWGFVSLYKINHYKKYTNFISFMDNLPDIGPSVTVTNNDSAYAFYGDYQTNPKGDYSIYYPFLDFTSQTQLFNKTWTIDEGLSNWVITQSPAFSLDKYLLSTPSSQMEVKTINQGVLNKHVLPVNFSLANNKLTVRFPKLLMESFDPIDSQFESCGFHKGDVRLQKKEQVIEANSTKGGVGCFGYNNTNLEQQYGYIIKIENRNLSGQRLYFYTLDQTKNQAYIEDRLKDDLQYYILGSSFRYGLGYNFSFMNTSQPNIPSINQLTNLELFLIPYNELKTLRLTRGEQPLSPSFSLDTFDTKKLNYSSYQATLDNNPSIQRYNNLTIVLSQSYDPGWKAYLINIKDQKSNIKNYLVEALPFLFGTELKEHVLVNNWANGWVIQDQRSAMEQFNNERIVILFWPQYLEYSGFLLLGLSFIFVLKTHR